ncbi:hypothetical protein [Oligoflexus sp.]|uniref:hypothetical protein n=1 Tax=Oligoflexus sp. TaxID=1971216 RepID=UPI002D78C9D6|nr:hypothetical protein [Oligoflexus sp.]
MVPQDFLIKQIQEFFQRILGQLLDRLHLAVFDQQDNLAAEMVLILEQLSGLDYETLEQTDARSLAYLLNLRCQGENKKVMAEVLRFQAACASRDPVFGSALHWQTIADVLENQSGEVVISRSTADLLRLLQDRRRLLE